MISCSQSAIKIYGNGKTDSRKLGTMKPRDRIYSTRYVSEEVSLTFIKIFEDLDVY